MKYELWRLEIDHRRGSIPIDQFRFHASSLLEQLGDFRACINLCEMYLIAASNEKVIGRLAYCYGELGDWEKAADTYRTMEDVWKNPFDALGFALAELRSGNPKEAKKIVEVVGLAHGHRKGPTEALIRELRSELYWADDDNDG